jgi:hypothetical protein
MRTALRNTLLLLVAVVAVTACQRRSSRMSALGSGGIGAVAGDPVAGGLFQIGKRVPGSPIRDASDLYVQDAGRKLIRNGEMSIEVRDFDATARKVAEIAQLFGGYVADSQASGDGGRRSGTMTIRVHAGLFDEAVKALRVLGKVQTEHVGTQDITKAYTDLEARLRVKTDAAERIRDILKTKSAKLADVLEAEKQLSALIEQIEVMKGERRFYDQQVALSTIAADLHEPEAVTRASAFAPLRAALRDSLSTLSESLAGFVTGTLYVLPWAALLFLLVSLWRRRRRAPKAQPVTD